MNEIVRLDVRPDLHNHTTGSDGHQTPLEAIVRGYRTGKNIISISDHDSVRGYRQLMGNLAEYVSKCEKEGQSTDEVLTALDNMRVLKGAELITSFNGVIVEVLGYRFDLEKMEDEIERLKTTVEQRPYEALYTGFKKIIQEKGLVFEEKVLDDAYEKVKSEGKGGVCTPFFDELYSHPENHYLLKYTDENGEEKIADTCKLFINKHLYNRESPLFVNMEKTRPSFKDTIDAIHRAGGKAFLAHAGRYRDKLDVKNLVDDMINQGLDGLEVFYPDHDYEFRKFLLEKVREHHILASGGSDDHNNEKEGIQYKTGRDAIPDIPETKWIDDSTQNGKDFLRESLELQNLINQLRQLREKAISSRKDNERGGDENDGITR